MTTTKIINQPILLVDDEQEILDLTRLTLCSKGYSNVTTLQDSRKVMPFLARQQAAVVVLDLMMPHITGKTLLSTIVSENPGIQVIIMTASDDIDEALGCLRSGAFDYLLKPVEPDHLISVIDKALQMWAMREEVSSLKEVLLNDTVENPDAFRDIITCSKKMNSIYRYAEVVAKMEQPILITGETGVGKELMAKAVHKIGGAKGEFVSVNIAGLDEQMFSDTLFGHRKGAYTGANLSRDGLVKKAAGGTLFLDEIGDLGSGGQIKLLRLIQEGEYYQVGSDTKKKMDSRIILATNHDLQKMSDEGKFRKDLYYRLCTHKIQIPPLRERTEDLPLLLDYFLEKAAAGLGKEKPEPTPELTRMLSKFPWQGNIRQFKAMVTTAVAKHTDGLLGLKYFMEAGLCPQIPVVGKAAVAPAVNQGDGIRAIFGRFPTMEEVEEYMISAALEIAGGNKSVASSMLGLSRQTLINHTKI